MTPIYLGDASVGQTPPAPCSTRSLDVPRPGSGPKPFPKEKRAFSSATFVGWSTMTDPVVPSHTLAQGPVMHHANDEVGFANVLMPIGHTAFSRSALSTATVMAERYGASLNTIAVSDRGAAEKAVLRDTAAKLIGVNQGDDRAIVVNGNDPARAITRRSTELAPCLVCLSTRSPGRFVGAFTTSVANSLVSLSSQPFVAVGPEGERPAWLPAPYWPPPLSVDRIVAYVDGSAVSEQVLPVAAAWARALDMSLSIVTVTDGGSLSTGRGVAGGSYGSAGSARRYVDRLAERWSEAAPNVDSLAIRDPIGAASGLNGHLLHQRPTGLIAVAAQARFGMQRLLLGSTWSTIVRTSRSACLVVPVT